jgi:hypothetical protein
MNYRIDTVQAVLKLNERLALFPWLGVGDRSTHCKLCGGVRGAGAGVPWRSLQQLREHEASAEHCHRAEVSVPDPGSYCFPVLRIRIRIRFHQIHMFLGLPDPDLVPLVRGMDPRIWIRIRIHPEMSWICNTAFFHPGSEFFPSRIRIKEFKQVFLPKKMVSKNL